MEKINEDEVNTEEKSRKAVYKKDQREKNQLREKEATDKKNAELRLRMERVYEKVGRTAMPRSQKKRVKREKTEVKIDEHTLDRIKYLGHLEPVEGQQSNYQ